MELEYANVNESWSWIQCSDTLRSSRSIFCYFELSITVSVAFLLVLLVLTNFQDSWLVSFVSLLWAVADVFRFMFSFLLHLFYSRVVPGVPKKYPLKNFANFSRTIERYDIKFYTLTTHSIIQKREVSLHYLQNWQNYAAFSDGNLAVETLSKIVSTIQHSANAISANTFWVEINA